MRRSATAVLMMALLIPLAGCQEPQTEEDVQEPEAQSAMMQPDYYTTDPAAANTENSFAETYPVHQAEPSTTNQTALGAATTHMVAKGDTLFSLARRYYSDQRRWKDIWEANRNTVPDPNVIRVGQELVIP